jgi:hypothetical protein
MNKSFLSYGNLFLTFFFVANILLWTQSNTLRAKWYNVPLAPTHQNALMLNLGDAQMSYRSLGLVLQNFGDTGGRTTSIKDYNFENLAGWFALMDRLDPEASYMPFLASYYYGITKNKTALPLVIDYLHKVGRREGKEKWRWLFRAVYLARYELKDLDLAYLLATELSLHPEKKRPLWSFNMPAFIQAERGDKKAAYEFMKAMLETNLDELAPNEVNFIVDYICNRILTDAEAAQDHLCALIDPKLKGSK